MAKKVTWHAGKVTRADRVRLLGRQNKVLWFTGLSGSGKSTLAVEVEHALHEKGILTFILDGDNVRHGLNKDLGFSKEDREENIRRIAEMTKLFYEAGVFVLVCFISPFRKERQLARKLIGDDFVEIYVKCPLEVCEERDPKGLYSKARSGEIKEFTGISSPYEEPAGPEIVVETSRESISESVRNILSFLSF